MPGERVRWQLKWMLHASFKWKQYPKKQQLYDHLPPISQTSQMGWARHAEYSWRSKDKLISDFLQWPQTHGHTSYIHQLCADIGCHLDDLQKAMNDRDRWEEREWLLLACLNEYDRKTLIKRFMLMETVLNQTFKSWFLKSIVRIYENFL